MNSYLVYSTSLPGAIAEKFFALVFVVEHDVG